MCHLSLTRTLFVTSEHSCISGECNFGISCTYYIRAWHIGDSPGMLKFLLRNSHKTPFSPIGYLAHLKSYRQAKFSDRERRRQNSPKNYDI